MEVFQDEVCEWSYEEAVRKVESQACGRVSMVLSLEKHGGPPYIVCDLVQTVGGDGLLGC